jgi:transcriptional regulator with XRE-family HTH domain
MTFNQIGDRLRLIRILLNLTQGNLAVLTGVKASVLNKVEQNAYRPAASVLSKIAGTLCMEMPWLIEGTPPMLAKRLAFFWLNTEESGKYGSGKRSGRLTPALAKEIVAYLVEFHGVGACCLIQSAEKSFAILRYRGKDANIDYIVLNTDVYTHVIVRNALAENKVELSHETMRIDGPGSDDDSLLRGLSRAIEGFYLEKPTEKAWEKLGKAIYRYAGEKGEASRHLMLAEFGKVLRTVKPDDVFSPSSVRPPDNVSRLLELVRDLDASAEDVRQVLERMES